MTSPNTVKTVVMPIIALVGPAITVVATRVISLGPVITVAIHIIEHVSPVMTVVTTRVIQAP